MAEDELPSFMSQIRALKKGDSVAKAKRLPIGKTDPEDINDFLLALRRTVNTAASRAREATGSNFRVDSGLMVTSDNEAVLAVVSVTRG